MKYYEALSAAIVALLFVALLPDGCDAAAETSPPETTAESPPVVDWRIPESPMVGCNYVIGNSVWAIADFPGATIAELATVQTLGHRAAGEPPKAPPGFFYVQLPTFVRHGQVAVNCEGDPVYPPRYDHVLFVVP